ncbi:hypothetical protein [Pseudonocardia sp. N23]|uniref:hypothetical protein n=1 Tax=Pseudonocardia sp. N23 TaxID=1987376 RepID=UPI001558B7DB|nr:hypothetical protein [Pseudonocardia sp. N23]
MIAGLDGPPGEIDGALRGDRRPDTGEEALQPQGPLQLLGADSDRGPDPAPQLALGDRQQLGQRGRSAAPPRHEVPDGLVHERVRLAGRLGDERVEPVERGPWGGGGAEGVGQPGHVAPQVGARDVPARPRSWRRPHGPR